MSNAALTDNLTAGVYETVIQAMDQGFCLVEMIFDQANAPVDYRFLHTNPAFTLSSGLSNVVGKTAREVLPDIEAFWLETYGQVALSGVAARFEHRSNVLGASFEVFATQVGGAASRQVAIFFNNISARKQAEERLHHLAEISSSLAAAQGLEQVRAILLGDVVRALGSNGGALRLVTAEGLVLEEHVRGQHPSEITVRKFVFLPLADQHPAAEVARTGEARFFQNPQEILEAYPDLAHAVTQVNLQAHAHLPLKRGGETFAVLSLSFPERRTWTEDERSFALALADRTALAYERARLYDEARDNEIALRDNAARLRAAVNITGITFAQLDRDLRYQWVYNTHADFDSGSVLGKRDDELLPPELAQPWIQFKQQALESGTGVRTQISVPLSNGTNVYDLYTEPLRDGFGQVVGITTAALDITEHHRAQQQLKNALHEKEVLLKEVYHRVKNNLQITSSLITLQRDKMTQPEVRRALQESINRIKSMALIHEKLYQSGDLGDVHFKEYLGSLVEHLSQAYQTSTSRVTIITNCADIALPLDAAVPCGLIINELVSNAFKHAFPEGRCGTIRVTVTCGAGDLLRLEVADDGVGFPAGLEPQQSGSLGLLLVSSLSEQLGGELLVETRQGTTFQVLFETTLCAERTRP